LLNFEKHISEFANKIPNLRTEFSPKEYIEEYSQLLPLLEIVFDDVDSGIKRLNELEELVEKQVESMIDESNEKEEGEAMSAKEEANEVYMELMDLSEAQIYHINKLLEIGYSPYFGHVEFSSNSTSLKVTSYIGKHNYIDKISGQVYITDWRSPIAALYYENDSPRDGVELSLPNGILSGELTSKKIYDIRESRIRDVYITQSGNKAADEFLLGQLKDRKGDRLSDIISTIQSEQNSIIRQKLDGPTILQGVAGSGKTSIALHRISYLLFSKALDLNPKRCLYIVPNILFKDYVSDIKPTLGLQDIKVDTYTMWAKRMLRSKDEMVLSESPSDLRTLSRMGESSLYSKIEELFQEYVYLQLEGIDPQIRKIMIDRLVELETSGSSLDWLTRVNVSLDYASHQLREKKRFQKKTMMDRLEETLNQADIYKFILEKTHITSKFEILEEVESEEVTEPDDMSDLADELFSDIQRKSEFFGVKKGKPLNKKKKIIYEEADLPILIIIESLLNGTSGRLFEYIVVDEAQDMSYLQIMTLLKFAKNSNISLVGDTAQSIIQPTYFDNWNSVISSIQSRSDKKVDYYEIFKCYRTTKQIVSYAANIGTKVNLFDGKSPEAVLREGKEVREIEINISSEIESFLEIIRESYDSQYKTFAVLTYDEAEAKQLHELLSANITENEQFELKGLGEDDYTNGIYVLPITKSKGLEFDNVILTNLNSDTFKLDLESAKLAYVGATRALHNLTVTYKPGNKSKLID
jgi:DNA helicase-2/ATP-dependent DNA helicase PcrA